MNWRETYRVPGVSCCFSFADTNSIVSVWPAMSVARSSKGCSQSFGSAAYTLNAVDLEGCTLGKLAIEYGTQG